MSEKDVLQKIVEGIDINSEDELEFHDAVDSKTADAGGESWNSVTQTFG
jgi:hypothetical protein